MSDNENKVKEYDMIRAEIMQKIELHNNLSTFTITTSVAVLSFAFSQNNAFLYLIPFCIIIPMSLRISYYLSAMTKLSSYMIVFLENDGVYNWETNNRELINTRISKKKNRVFDFTSQRYYEHLILSIVCYFLYAINYIQYNQFDWTIFINLLWPLLLVAFEGMVTRHLNSMDKEKNARVQEWKKLKEQQLNNSNDISTH